MRISDWSSDVCSSDLAVVVQIQFPRFRVHDDIFQHCAEPLRRGVNFGLGFSRQADHLGVAAAFEIEDRRIRPAMFIVADQCTAGICRQGGLRSEEHTSELQSLMRSSYAVFCLKKKNTKNT